MAAQCPILGVPFWLIYVIIFLDGVLKIIAMWRAGRNNQLGWFICIAIINTAGILPIVYLLMHKKKEAID